MKATRLITISFGVLLIAYSIQNAACEDRRRNLLEITTPLKDKIHFKNDRVTLSCEVKNATSYRWYKYEYQPYYKYQLLNQIDHNLELKGGELTIKHFNKTYEGKYKCEGRDEDGNTGKTHAWITFQDPCRRVREKESKCFLLNYEQECSHIKSFAPKAENLQVALELDYKMPWPYDIYFAVTWDIPRQGRESIWGWQLRVIGTGGYAFNYQRCYQYNYFRPSHLPNQQKTVVEVPYPASTYTVELLGLPNFVSPHYKTIVRKIKKVPGWCEMGLDGVEACCGPYVNATLSVIKQHKTTLFWTTHYPARLNVTIDAFIVSWSSLPDGRCRSNVVLNQSASNYTINLNPECRNYTIQLEVKFVKRGELKCNKSPRVKMQYISPPDLENSERPIQNTSVATPEQNTSVATREQNISYANATAAYVIAAILGGIVVATLVYVWRNRKVCKGGSSAEGNGCSKTKISTENVSVFILNPNHCDLCTEVVQTLGSLLIETGQISCKIDMFAPMQEKCQGLARWTQDMIFNSDYVIIPWMCEINTPKKDNMPVTDMNTLLFLSSLDIIHGELVRNPQRKDKFIPVCLDHCSLEILPANQVLLQTYNIPSKIDDLVIELLGTTRRRPDTEWPILEFDDKKYTTAKKNLEQAVNKMKKNHHHSRWQKNSEKINY